MTKSMTRRVARIEATVGGRESKSDAAQKIEAMFAAGEITKEEREDRLFWLALKHCGLTHDQMLDEMDRLEAEEKRRLLEAERSAGAATGKMT
jgi:hypothetical protein